MQNTNNTFNNFPSSSVEYFSNKPADLTNLEWLVCRSNPFYFCYWVNNVLLYAIHGLSLMRSYTFCGLEYLANKVGKSSRTLRDVLKHLVAIGVLDLRIIKKNKQYKVNWDFLRSGKTHMVDNYSYNTETSGITSAIFEDFWPESPFDSADYSDEIPANLRDGHANYIDLDHQPNDDFSLSDSKIPMESDKIDSLVALDQVEVEIKQEFEAMTGKPLNLKKNLKPLTQLKEIAQQTKDIVVLAFRNVANHIAETGTKIYNLGYVLTAAKNLMHPKTTSKDYVSSSEKDKAHASIGGDHAKYRQQEPTETPEQTTQRLKQESQAIELELKKEALRTELFNALGEQDKNELIEMEIDYLKTQPIWEKLKPTCSWIDSPSAFNHAVSRIKEYLLYEHLVIQPSG